MQVLYDFLKEYALQHDLPQTMGALVFAAEKHEGQFRSGKKQLPYIIHPMIVAMEALSMGFDDDDTVAACLLHDVMEDCGVKREELPVSEKARDIVQILTRDEENRYTEEGKKIYYSRIAEHPQATLIKLLDRVSNVIDMGTGFSRAKMLYYVGETERWILPMFEKAEEYFPDRKVQLMILRYEMENICSTVKRLGKEREVK